MEAAPDTSVSQHHGFVYIDIRHWDVGNSVGSSKWMTQEVGKRCHEMVAPERVHVTFVGVREDEERFVHCTLNNGPVGGVAQRCEEP
jgi:hypothetical protein